MANPIQQKSVFREYAESLFVALVLALIIRTFFLQAFKIPTGSMQPTLMVGDRILVDKVRYGIKIPFTHWRLPAVQEPQRGDVVVFEAPDESHRDFIKRLIAVGGDEVEIRDLHVWVNGRPLSDPPILREIFYYNRGPFGQGGRPVKVPPGCYFFLGDNSGSSKDSRYWGFLPKDKIVGRAFVIYLPLRRIRWIR